VKLYVFDDRRAGEWQPFSLSRPCAELRFGVDSLRGRLERFAGTPASGALARPWLGSFSEDGAPPVLSADDLGDDEDRLFLCCRAVPDPSARFEIPYGPATLEMEGEIVGVYLPSGSKGPEDEWFFDPSPLKGMALVVEGHVLRHVWELVERSAGRTAADLQSGLVDVAMASASGSWERIGDAPLRLAPDVRIEPGVLFDLRDGPICLDRNVEVLAGTRLTGPLYAGPSSRLLGGSISRLSAGPYSFLRGEIEDSVVLGYANKAHDGFLGHAYVGRWVNLGALTTNSDLKNTYGTVRLAGPADDVDTKLMKFGCLIGDHVKTAIGTLVPTGAVIGCGANILSRIPDKWVPPFSWGEPESVHRKDGFLKTAEIAAERRGIRFGAGERAWLSEVWEQATAARR
jgi:UDP-N-acetylglucosamine diphosphorylase/glucosamine-1-phosphate N-acetyltransferase